MCCCCVCGVLSDTLVSPDQICSVCSSCMPLVAAVTVPSYDDTSLLSSLPCCLTSTSSFPCTLLLFSSFLHQHSFVFSSCHFPPCSLSLFIPTLLMKSRTVVLNWHWDSKFIPCFIKLRSKFDRNQILHTY